MSLLAWGEGTWQRKKKKSFAQILTSKQTGLYCKNIISIFFSDYVTDRRDVKRQDDLISWQLCRLVPALLQCFFFLNVRYFSVTALHFLSRNTQPVFVPQTFKWWQWDEQYQSVHNTQAYILQERSTTCGQNFVSSWIWTEGIQVMTVQSNFVGK